eukprot:TRINITY_DN942_c0_g1_i1.p1 TRINITY_DN942_c0_g1~~TRINITY_DN942_c0_g1_i1.p1  ORF type:complete len:121 (-),score=8.39 TRINITY_DN942_c0_g1_i1:14-376(-)
MIFKHASKCKWCHFIRSCTCCGLSGYLVPTCPLRNVYITSDIMVISHTDPNPHVSFIDSSYPGKIIVPDTPSETEIQDEAMDQENLNAINEDNNLAEVPETQLDSTSTPVLCVDTTASYL